MRVEEGEDEDTTAGETLLGIFGYMLLQFFEACA